MVITAGAAYDVGQWTDFAVAIVGGAAALAGLLVVAASINIARIIELPVIVTRLAATLALFTEVLIVGLLLLVPGQARAALGAEIAVTGALLAVLMLGQRELRRLREAHRVTSVIAAVVGASAAALIAIGGIGLATRSIGGLYWLVPGVLLAICVGLLNSWVALVEILR